MAASDAELKIIASLDDQVSKSIEKLLGEVGKVSDEAKKAFDQMRMAAAKAADEADGAADSVAEIGKSAKKTGDDLKGVGDAAGRGFADVKDKIKDVAIGLFGLQQAFQIFKTSVLDAVNTSAEVDVINARISNFTGQSRAALGQLFADLNTFSLTNKQFVKEQEVSAAALLLLKDGFSNTATVVYDISEAYDFARVTGISLTDSTRLLTEANKALGDGTKNSVQLFSRLNFLFGKGFDNAGALAGALSALSNTAKQSGLKLDDAAVSLATLSETSSANEALRNLEVILKALQSRGGEVAQIFAANGRQFDETTVKTAGLRNVLAALLESIAVSGGDAQTELKKLFGSQEAVNAVLVLGSREAVSYSKNVEALSKSTSKLFQSTNNVREAEQGFVKFLVDQGYSAITNLEGAYEALDGTQRDLIQRAQSFTRAKAEESGVVRISTQAIAENSAAARESVAQVRSAIDTFGGASIAPKITEGFKEIEAVAAETIPAVQRWYEAVSGQDADPEIERIKSRIQSLVDQARKFSEIGVEGFLGEGLEFRLQEIYDFELLLLDELNAKREAARAEQVAKDEKAAADAAQRASEVEERRRQEQAQTLALQQQAELQAYQANLQRIRESAALSRQLIEEGISGAGAEADFFGDLSAQVQPLADEILRLEGVLANAIITDAERDQVVAKIQQIKGEIRSVGAQAVVTGEAFDAGFTGALNKFVDETANKFKQGSELASAGVNAFASSFSGLLNDIVLGSKSASDAFKDFIRNFIAGIVQAINQLIALNIARSILGALGFGGAAAGAAGAAVPAAAAGGVMSGTMQGSIPAGSNLGSTTPMGGASFFANGGVMAGTMLAAATGLPMRAYAQGGVTSEPQIAVFGEGRGAEAFVPLPGPNRGIPVEFQNTPASMASGRVSEPAPAPAMNITVAYNPSIQSLDGESTRAILIREAKSIGDIVASEIASGANRGLVESVRSKR